SPRGPDSTITRNAREPPGKTNADFPRWRRFAPPLFDRHHFFRIIFSVGSNWFRPAEKNPGAAKENCQYKETYGSVSSPIAHDGSVLAFPGDLKQTLSFLNHLSRF